MEKEKERLSKLSIYAQAFQLFREKKSLTEVVITLDLEADTVLYYYKDYLRLNHLYKLVNLYHSLGKDFPLFLHLFNRIKEEGLSREEIAYMIEIQSNIADKQETVVWLNKHISELGKEKQELEKDIIRLREIKMDLEQ